MKLTSNSKHWTYKELVLIWHGCINQNQRTKDTQTHLPLHFLFDEGLI